MNMFPPRSQRDAEFWGAFTMAMVALLAIVAILVVPIALVIRLFIELAPGHVSVSRTVAIVAVLVLAWSTVILRVVLSLRRPDAAPVTRRTRFGERAP